MSDLLAECDWHDSTLFLVLPEDPERIGVRLFPSRHAPSRVYVPEAEIARTKAENAKLRKLASELYQQVLQDDAAWHDVRAWEDGLPSDCLHPIRSYDDSLGKHAVAPKFEQRMRELGIEADDA